MQNMVQVAVVDLENVQVLFWSPPSAYCKGAFFGLYKLR